MRVNQRAAGRAVLAAHPGRLRSRVQRKAIPLSKPATLLDARGNPFQIRAKLPTRHPIRARYDAASHSEETARHWAMADGMSARSANSAEVRRRLRVRARYERDNSSHLKGIIDTLANDCIGTGPRLQLSLTDQNASRAIERAFSDWCQSVDLAAKLRTMRKSKAVDGEAFALFVNNPRLDSLIQLDLRLVEADQIATPQLNPLDPYTVDGIRYDDHGNPIEYSLLKYHPGDFYNVGLYADPIDARMVIHWFTAERPGQCRGVPDITPALPLFAQLRRYTLAVIAAAETAADFSAVLQSEMAPDADTSDEDPFQTLEIERRMMTTLPAGWKMSQFHAEQPTNTYESFKREILNEAARCLNMPYNIAACNSSQYNYASGRLDHQTYYKSLSVEQSACELTVLDRVFLAWIEEAWLVTDLIPGGPNPLGGWPHRWFWDGHEHVDPLKEAMAQQVRLANHTTTYADEDARRGQDYDVQLRQRAKELALLSELGLPMYLPSGQIAGPTPDEVDQMPDDSEVPTPQSGGGE
jgi:lambda family phage portal protein